MIKSERIKVRDEIERQYGIHIAENDEMLPILHFIYTSTNEINEDRKKNEKAYSELVNKINRPVYNFSSGEAWKFQIAISLKWLFIGLTLNLVLWLSLSWWTSINEIEEAKKIIQSSDRITSSLLNNVKKDKDGFFFLEFKEAPGNSIENFTEYEKVGSKTIRVYLGKTK